MKLIILFSFTIILFLIVIKVKSNVNSTVAHHINNGFRNPRVHKNFGLIDYPRAIWEQLHVKTKKDPQPTIISPLKFLQANVTESTITWIGHSTFLIQHKGYNIITDPHFSNRASPFTWIGPKRVTPLTIELEQLPHIDFVVISHNHYDHLDKNSLKKLLIKQKNNPPHIFVPLKLKKWFQKIGFENVIELDWWENTIIDNWEITAVPAQHYSGRNLFDKNNTLWCGWVIKTTNFSYYFSGDTGYSEDFKEIGKRLGPFDLATINIGAYGPEWASNGVHLNPENAVQVHKDVKSKLSIAAHWGTFILSFEDIDEPPKLLKNQLLKQGIDLNTFITLKHGETIKLFNK